MVRWQSVLCIRLQPGRRGLNSYSDLQLIERNKMNLLMELSNGGKVIIEMKEDLAPNHVKQITTLVNDGFYDGLKFHRVIEGFMAQTGCPNGDGTGNASTLLEAEFNNEKHIRGTVSMARSQDPNSASSQFFICYGMTSHLDGQYTVWGQVVEGMEHVDALKKGNPKANGSVDDPDYIVSMKLDG